VGAGPQRHDARTPLAGRRASLGCKRGLTRKHQSLQLAAEGAVLEGGEEVVDGFQRLSAVFLTVSERMMRWLIFG